jgi:hypothetical protein
MAYTEIARFSTTTVRSSAQTATTFYTLPSAPASGQWIVVALYTSQGIIPTLLAGAGFSQYAVSVTCGSVGLSLVETSFLTSIQSPTVFAAPYTAGMTTSLSVRWQNTIAATTLGVVSLIFSGAYTGSTTGYADFRTSTNGSFDGAGDSTFGLTQAQGLSGKIAWTQSNATIPTQYDSQQEPFVSAMFLTASNNTPPIKTLNGAASVVNNSGVYNVTTDGWGIPGQLLLSDVTSVYNGAGQIVINSPSGNFVASYTGAVGFPYNLLTDVTTTAAALGASLPSGTMVECPLNVNNTIAAVLPTLTATNGTLGGFQTKSNVAVNFTTGTVGRLVLIAGQNTPGKTRQSAYGHLRISGANSAVGGGVIYTFVPATRTLSRSSTASRTLSSLTSRLRNALRSVAATVVRSTTVTQSITRGRIVKVTSVLAAVSARQTALNRSVKAAIVQAGRETKSLVKLVRASGNLSAKSARQTSKVRAVVAASVRAARVGRSRSLFRSARATSVPVAYSIRRKSVFRSVVATRVYSSLALAVASLRSHAGQAEPGFMTPDTRTTFISPSADGSISAPGGSSSWGVKE